MKGVRKLDSPKGRARSTRYLNRLEQLYKISKCRECSVDVIRMDFKKMMGKFTKVKIQYENNDFVNSAAKSRVKTRKSSGPDINVATRLRSNENGMVLIHRKAYNKHPVNKEKINETKSPSNVAIKNQKNETKSACNVANKDKKNESKNAYNIATKDKKTESKNVLKESNCQLGNKALNLLPKSKKSINLNVAHASPQRLLKQYYLAFTEPKGYANAFHHTKRVAFKDILLKINKAIMPTNDWLVEFLPIQRNEQDVVYDRIAAELEGLMPSEESPIKEEPSSSVGTDTRNKPPEDFPSIMDILNEEPMSVDHDKPISKANGEPRTNDIQASDIEAMLTGSNDADLTSTLTADNTTAISHGDITATSNKSASSKTNLVTEEVIKTMDILPSDKIAYDALKSGFDSKVVNIAPKETSEESVKEIISKDEKMDVDDAEKETNISPSIVDNTSDVVVADSLSDESTHCIMVKEKSMEDKNLEKEEITLNQQLGAVSNNSDDPAVDQNLVTIDPEAAVESRLIEDENQKNDQNPEKSKKCINIKPIKQNVSTKLNDDSVEEIKTPKIEEVKMETNGIVLEGADSHQDILKNTSRAEDVKRTSATSLVIKESKTDISQQDNIIPIMPEFYNSELVTHVLFKCLTDTKDSKSKTVIFHNSFDYDVEIEGKKVQLLGAPKSINHIEDLKVLLQIVNETGLNSFNIVH